MMNEGIDRDEVRDEATGNAGSTAPADQARGSPGSGGYGDMQNQQQGRQQGGLPGYGSNPEQSRGERFDEAQGGGRGPGSVSSGEEGDGGDEIARDQRAHQDRGQGDLECERG
jgi:hypothetical protein